MYIFIRLVRRHATMQRRFIFLGFIYTKRNGRKSSMYDPKKEQKVDNKTEICWNSFHLEWGEGRTFCIGDRRNKFRDATIVDYTMTIYPLEGGKTM